MDPGRRERGPGLGLTRAAGEAVWAMGEHTFGATTRIGLTYYFYPGRGQYCQMVRVR
jgi:hypothetical protein